MNDTKYCERCQEYKPKSEFAAKSGHVYSACKECRRAYSREWMRKRKERIPHATVWDTLYAAMGRKCARCGYYEFDSPLEFTSVPDLDPTPKLLLADAVNHFVYNPSPDGWEELLRKLEGHVLLCANCKQALRNRDWELEELPHVTPMRYRPGMPTPT